MKKSALYTLVGAIVANVLSSIIYALIENVNFIEAFFNIWGFIFDFMVNLLNFEIKLWHIIALVLILFAILYSISRSQTKPIPKTTKEYLKYTSGQYKGINYKWILDEYDNTISINDISFRPVCDCGGELTLKRRHGNRSFSSERLFCVNCEKLIDSEYNHEIHEDAMLFFSNNLGKKIEEYNKTIFG
ncbi:hypothetical protein [Erysipelothrix anatis]|uniref:hypothetical protein n=1 Tax=Erysipelothrix anatis TaxID=2683713 RepID=UPI0014074751|nr:hypothetical protein [Erysipelothrix anatis]